MIDKFKKDVEEGLSSNPKSLPSKYFYDKKGDELFVNIMHLPEYYVTRAELEIFTNKSNEIIDSLQLNKNVFFELIEFGAGDGLKTKKLLSLLDEKKYKFEYIPIDISQNVLDVLVNTLNKELPNVSVNPMQGDYFQVLDDLHNNKHLKIVLFLGSNIGNMPDKKAAKFIYKIGSYLNNNDKLFLGVDLIKEKAVVLPAYNDSQGITKEFNFNLLNRINDELDADFKIDNFKHEVEYTETEGIVKSYLVSDISQTVSINSIQKDFHFIEGEKVLTEISRKYSDEIINKLILKTDFNIIEKLSDSNMYFSDYILVKNQKLYSR